MPVILSVDVVREPDDTAVEEPAPSEAEGTSRSPEAATATQAISPQDPLFNCSSVG